MRPRGALEPCWFAFGEGEDAIGFLFREWVFWKLHPDICGEKVGWMAMAMWRLAVDASLELGRYRRVTWMYPIWKYTNG